MNAKGDKMIKATLTHARKYGFMPSVTSIISDTHATSQSLIDWIVDQHVTACMTNPFEGNLADVEVADQYKGMIKAKANEYRDYTANRGKQIHMDVELWILSGCKALPFDPVSKEICCNLDKYFKDNDVTKIDPECSLFSSDLGFAGTPDIPCVCSDGAEIMIDLKTTSFKSYRKPYDSWKFQLGGYRLLSKQTNSRLVQAIGDRDHGDVIFEEYNEEDG